MTTPTVQVLESIDVHPVLVQLSPYNNAAAAHMQWLESDGSESYVRFDNGLAHLTGVWVHSDIAPSVFRRMAARVVPQVQYVAWKPEVKAPREFRVAIDFDNVVHSYTSPWSASADITDPPLPGAVEWLERLADEGARIILHTCRFTAWNPDAAGFIAGDPIEVESAVWDWLKKHGLSDLACERITMWTWVGKPYADAYVDDKAIEFEGLYHDVGALRTIVELNKGCRVQRLGA